MMMIMMIPQRDIYPFASDDNASQKEQQSFSLCTCYIEAKIIRPWYYFSGLHFSSDDSWAFYI